MVYIGYTKKKRYVGQRREVCPRCGYMTDHGLVQTKIKASLMFVLLLPLGSRLRTRCLVCGQERKVKNG